MLITDNDQQTVLKIIKHKTCARCQKDLDYPRIVATDTDHSSYHMQCALDTIQEITHDLQILLNDFNALNRLEVVTLFQKSRSS